MTNNEAAKWIQLYIDLAKIDPTTGEAAYLNDDDKKTIEAMEMAINALTAQPETHDKRTETHSCDCISRQAAIDALTRFITPHDNGDGTMTVGVLSKSSITDILNDLPSAQPDSKELSFTQKKLDTISRQAAIRWVKTECNPYGKPTLDFESGKKVIEHLKQMPSAQPEQTNSWYINSWCNNCKEYDTEKHSCPRFNRVIKQTLDEIYSHAETEAEARYHAEIIACGDCKHWICHDRRCGYWNHGVRAIDWCSHAERRTDEADYRKE